ncbi:glycine cleavage system protein T [cyanobiont of Ornithocercus magnificus]|nr:glycine cleavage system protein T [cyanobiont of Ornithocercus magnificus]
MIAKLWSAEFPLIRLEGDGAAQFLHGQTSADVCGAGLDVLVDACLLTAAGKVRALLEIRVDRNGAGVLVLAGDAEAVHTGFDTIIFPADKVRLLPLSRCHRVQQLTTANTLQLERYWLATSEDLPPEWLNLPVASQEEVERWRIRLDLPLGRGEVDGSFNPLELGLEAWVSLSKGCYLGQETIIRLVRANGRLRQRLCSWQATTSISVGTKLKDPGGAVSSRNVGVVTSSISLDDKRIGLAMIHRQALNATSLVTTETNSIVQLTSQSIYPGCSKPQD